MSRRRVSQSSQKASPSAWRSDLGTARGAADGGTTRIRKDWWTPDSLAMTACSCAASTGSPPPPEGLASPPVVGGEVEEATPGPGQKHEPVFAFGRASTSSPGRRQDLS